MLQQQEYQTVAALKIAKPCPADLIPLVIKFTRSLPNAQERQMLFRWIEASRKVNRMPKHWSDNYNNGPQLSKDPGCYHAMEWAI